jgi:acetyl esterase/lipase
MAETQRHLSGWRSSGLERRNWIMSLRLTAALAMLVLASPVEAADPTDLTSFIALPRPTPTAEVRYGAASSQAIDLFLPSGPGPYPVAVLIHGGCWRNLSGAGREQLRHLGPELTSRGIAVWSIGYRRADEPGGGYPGTFQDVGHAIDRLRLEAERYNLDLQRTALVGHSAGGHLALWASARRHLPGLSPLHQPDAFVPKQVISLAGIGDLAGFARFVPVLCGPGIIERLSNLEPGGSGAAYGEINPAALSSPGVQVLMISGVLDRLVPPYVAHDYARATRGKSGPTVELLNIVDSGHFDLVVPGTAAWTVVRSRIEAALVDARTP